MTFRIAWFGSGGDDHGAVIVDRDLGRRIRSRPKGRHRRRLVMPEHSRQALPKEKEEADCADKQPDPTHYVSDERHKFNVVRTLRAVAVTGTIFEAGHEPPP
jgi:hypothetical protein